MITPQSYAHSLSKSEKLVSDSVKEYLKEPSEDNVHDLRTSIRRLLTTANILPKKIRGEKESKRYLEDREKLLRLNAKVRDIDIILSKLPHHGDDPEYAKLARHLQRVRESSLKKANRFAESINDKTNSPLETPQPLGTNHPETFQEDSQSAYRDVETAFTRRRERTQEYRRATQATRGFSEAALHS